MITTLVCVCLACHPLVHSQPSHASGLGHRDFAYGAAQEACLLLLPGNAQYIVDYSAAVQLEADIMAHLRIQEGQYTQRIYTLVGESRPIMRVVVKWLWALAN